jgi:hypothetical protein
MLRRAVLGAGPAHASNNQLGEAPHGRLPPPIALGFRWPITDRPASLLGPNMTFIPQYSETRRLELIFLARAPR